MKREQINYIFIGAFVLAMGGIFAFIIALLSGKTGSTDEYYVSFPNVSGIVSGTPVTYEGFQIGQVADISPARINGKTRYRLNMAIVSGWKIPKDSVARIVASGLLSQVTVDIAEGKEEAFLRPGDEIANGSAVNIFESMTSIADNVNDLTENSIKPLMKRLYKGTDVMVASMEKSAPIIMEDLQTLTTTLNQKILPNIDEATKTIKNNSQAIEEILRPENRRHIDLFFDNLEITAKNFKTASIRLKETQAKVDTLVGNVNQIVLEDKDEVKRSLLSLRAAIENVSGQIEAITYNLESASRNINEFSLQIRQNPSLLLGSQPPKEAEP